MRFVQSSFLLQSLGGAYVTHAPIPPLGALQGLVLLSDWLRALRSGRAILGCFSFDVSVTWLCGEKGVPKTSTNYWRSASILKHADIIWLPCGSVTSSAMMEKKAFSSSRLRVCSFLMYYVTTSVTSFRMILDVYCAFFHPVSRCSRSVSSPLAIISRTAQKFPLLGDVLVRSSLDRSPLDRSSLSPRSGQFCFPQNTTVSIMLFRTWTFLLYIFWLDWLIK